jgi:hypothetical protein
MIKVGDKYLRNLEEQVQYLTNYHNVNQGLVQWGIRVVGQVETEDELPLPYDGEYGDAIAVGTESPFFFYIWTRASIEGKPAYWFPFGEISAVGPEGPKGEQGPVGPAGEASRWYVGSDAPSSSSQYVEGDMYLQSNGQVYRYQNDSWQSVVSIKGPQGIQGIQGPQGIQGIQGIQGPKGERGDVGGLVNIRGILSNVGQLPLPSSLQNLTVAYLVGTEQPYDLYIQAGDTPQEAVWTNTGPFNAATMVTVNGQYQNIWDADTKANVSELTNYLKKADFNLENGNGNGSIKQKGTVTVGGYSGNIKAQAQGPASVALNGLYQPRQGLKPESDGVIAAGPGSLAGGKDTKAYQACSFAFGGGNKAGLTEAEFNAKYSSGKDPHGKTYAESYSFATAEGVTTKATGYAAHAENESTEATGHRSHASGQETEATGDRSFATGYKTNATNQNSFTMGEETDATGINSLAGGFNSTSSAYCSLAFGENCEATNNDAVATGYYTQANGKYSFAAGRACQAFGEGTVTVGRSNKTIVDYQFVCGTYCEENTPDALFVVGNGKDTNNRGNAFEVLKDGRAKVYTAPKEARDVVNKAYVDSAAQASASASAINQWTVRVFDYIQNTGYFEVFFNVLVKKGTTANTGKLLQALNNMGANEAEFCHMATGAVGDVGTMRNKVIGVFYDGEGILGIAYDNGTNIIYQSITLTNTNTTIKVYDPAA